MSITADTTLGPDADTHGHDGHDDKHFSDGQYVIVAIVLAVLTALEVSTYFVDFGSLMIPTLLILMVIKFFTVISFFMHLKFDNKLFSFLFYAGLGLAVGVYLGALATFKFFV